MIVHPNNCPAGEELHRVPGRDRHRHGRHLHLSGHLGGPLEVGLHCRLFLLPVRPACAHRHLAILFHLLQNQETATGKKSFVFSLPFNVFQWLKKRYLNCRR